MNKILNDTKSRATNIDCTSEKSRATNIDCTGNRATNSNININKGHIPSGNVPELSNQSDMLDSIIDYEVIYTYFNATKDWQKQNVNEAIKVYKDLLIKYLLDRSHYTKDCDLYQFPHDEFKRKVGTVSIYKSKPAKEEYLVQVILKLSPVYQLIDKGNNLTQKVSLMKLNFNFTNIIRTQCTDELLVKMYGNVDITDPNVVDITPINIKSLESYIKGNEALPYQNDRIKNYNDQANMILLIAKATGGVFPQIINESDFGRRYYKGKSLQIVSSVVRKAALGDHFEYDLNAAVYSIKLNVCAFINETKFTYTSEYLEFKEAIRKRLTKLVFGDEDKFHNDIIKQAITAIGFGARSNNNGYYDNNGTWSQTSLQDIFSYTSKETGKRVLAKSKFANFINDKWVVEFINEQQQMTDIITDYYKDNNLVTKQSHPFLVDGRNSINKNKLMAYVFQTIERDIMDTACEFIKNSNVKVLLRVHDAVYTDKKIDMRELHATIHQGYQSKTLAWAGSKIISFEEIETQGFYYETEDESDIEEAWERLTGVAQIKSKVKLQHRPQRKVIEGYYDGNCDYGQTEYDPENDPYIHDMNDTELNEHYRILGYTPGNNLPSFVEKLL